MNKKQKWFLAGVILLALFFRFFQIAASPGGLYPDEAAEGLDAHLIQQGHWQPFYERGNGREGLFYYIIALVITLFGTGVAQLHATSAGIGFLAVIVCFLLARELFSLEGKTAALRANWLALLAAFFMAVSSWHVVLSRTAFRANLIPLFSALTFYLLILTYKAKTKKTQFIFSILTGAAFAGGFYTYIAYRVLAGIVAILVLWPLLASLRNLPWYGAIKKYWVHFALMLVAFTIVIYPLAHYFYVHPGSFVGRSDQVSIFNQNLNGGDLKGTFLEVTRESFLAYFKNGDLNWRHNISGAAFLSPIISPFFGIGLIGVTVLAAFYMFSPKKRASWWKYALLAGSFWGLLLPAITTAEGIPHGLRSIGTIPFVFIITAWGLFKTIDFIKWVINQRHFHTSQWKKNLIDIAVHAMVFTFFAALIFQTYILYFIFAANSPENFYSFRSDLTVASDYLNDHGNKDTTYLVVDDFSAQTPEFLTTLDPTHPDNPKNQPYKWVKPEDFKNITVLPQNSQVVFAQSSLYDIKSFKEHFPESKLIQETRNKFGQTVMAVYKIDLNF